MNIEAVIFDMDGLMINSEFLNAKAFVYAMQKFGFDFPGSLEWYFEYGCGNRRDKTVERIRSKLPPDADFQKLIKEFVEYRTQLLKSELRPQKGLFELLEFLKSKNIKMAIATSGIIEEVDLKLGSAGIPTSCFQTIIFGFDVKEPKPHPEVYQIACKRLGVEPQNAIALEDSDYGIESAVSAGLRVILVNDVKINDPKSVKKAFEVVDSLDKVVSILERTLENGR